MFNPSDGTPMSGQPKATWKSKGWFQGAVILSAGVLLGILDIARASEQTVPSCGATVSIKGLKEYVGIQPPPSRVVTWRAENRAEKYQIQKQDVIRFSSQVNEPLTVEPLGKYLGPSSSKDWKTASLPVWVIQDAESIKVSAGSRMSVIICVTKPSCDDSKELKVDLSESTDAATWEKRIGSTVTWLKAELVPIDPGLVLPGDEVKVGIDFDLRLGESDLGVSGNFPLPIRATSTVQSDGSISIPRLGFVSPLLKGANDSGTPANAYRAIAAATEADDSRIIVSPSNRKQIPLWELARCLNSVERLKPPPPTPTTVSEPAKQCLAARIDGRFNPIQDIYQWQRYTLEPGPRTWTLVDADGRAYQVPFQYGRSVEEAVTRLYPRKTGHDLKVDRLGPYATVLPSSESWEEPFYGRLKEWPANATENGKGSNRTTAPLGNISLRAGDTVIVTCSSPQTGN